MQQIYPDLWQTTCYQSGMLSSHAYYLQSAQGRLLIYNTNNDADLREMETLGGVDYQLLSHRDEAANSLQRIKEQFGSQLLCSKAESAAVSSYADIDLEFNSDDSQFVGLTILHTPGHTDGSICFYYPSPHGKNYLFTGDTLFQWKECWSTLILKQAGGSKEALLDSLSKLRELDVDVVMSSAFVEGRGVVELDRGQWPQIIDEVISRVD